MSNSIEHTKAIPRLNKLTPERVNELFTTCLIQHDISCGTDDDLIVEGIKMKVAFSKKSLAILSDDIKVLISQLPENAFNISKGNGMPFILLCNNKDGELWTGVHRIIEELIMLAIGINCCKYLLPKKLWKLLPGRLPYVVFDLNEFKN